MDFYFIGDDELVTAFRFIGIEGTAVKDAADAAAVFRRVTEDKSEPGAENCKILILTEETADWLGESLIDWQISARYPLLVEIPGISGRHIGRKTLVEQVREAVGIHV